jgi:uncharacterized membrane protein
MIYNSLSEKEYLDIKNRVDEYDYLFEKYFKSLSILFKSILILIFVAFFIWAAFKLKSLNQYNKVGILFIGLIGILILIFVGYYLNLFLMFMLKIILERKTNYPTKNELELFRSYSDNI